MRDQSNAFHLAIPTHDLGLAEDFYVRLLGCKLARRYDDRITLDFFGDQVVCHLSEGKEPQGDAPLLYPRHFGVTFRLAEEFEALLDCCVLRKIPLFLGPVTRFDGMVEVHRTFVLRDPSDNLIEFKHYRDPRMMY